MLRNFDIPAELGPCLSAEKEVRPSAFQGGVASRLGLPIPSIGHVGLMTILHPVADWLAIAADIVSAMMAATGED